METTHEPDSPHQAGAPTTSASASRRHRLTRSRSDRVIAGVAGGVAQYLDVDPILVRVGFAVLAVFGGSGVMLYVLGWLLLPEDGASHSLAEDALGRRGRWGRGRHHGIASVGLFIVAVLIVTAPFRQAGWDRGWVWGPLVLIGLGVVLLSRDRRTAWAPPSSDPDGEVGGNSETGATAWLAPQPRPASLTPFLVGGLAILGGLAALLDIVGWLHVSAAGFLGVALAIAGGLMVLGAIRGRVAGVVAIGMALAVALAASLVVPGAVTDGIGNREWHPTTSADLMPSYRLGIGDAILDLRNVPVTSPNAPTTFRASVGIGHLLVIVPHDATIRTRERSDIGQSVAFGARQGGISVDRTRYDPGTGPVALSLDLRVRIGRVEVARAV